MSKRTPHQTNIRAVKQAVDTIEGRLDIIANVAMYYKDIKPQVSIAMAMQLEVIEQGISNLKTIAKTI